MKGSEASAPPDYFACPCICIGVSTCSFSHASAIKQREIIRRLCSIFSGQDSLLCFIARVLSFATVLVLSCGPHKFPTSHSMPSYQIIGSGGLS
jgi:hypothetical protein